ncbi:hypothetical protein [Mycolicibacterium thermoresistibile]|jgi:Mce-associated membrane protein|uniref:Mce associated membrane protein n=2 Tax=Mycolicibacterium thermoresistibile TaxID=1797 RepID=G7CE70_MYCT3|nr:hypothetical protein [Mycolicibacterium thermoresistibile]EHI13719.1 hypothetical protein KEK_06408 [Mycolicibacterium thermoresistibile ATCC 19527]MCV7189353.1 Mce protein [Mycolicibacterium thermoresistibile]GAT14440.1 putative uncharacterized protein [Mycolicibacterium thermoresistibile]SNW19673.1 MCE associated membrane protein [Mycolicibacterium thermoresistibile]
MAEPTPDQDDVRDPDATESTSAELAATGADADGETAAAADTDSPGLGTESEKAGPGEERDTEPATNPEHGAGKSVRGWITPIRLAGIIGLVLVLALGGAVGWLGYRTYQMQRDADLRAQFLEAGRQGAFALTNVNWEQADADVQRILDAATGSFYDDMQRRAPSYTELVKQAQSVSKGDVTEVGLESFSEKQGTVLASVIIESSNVGVPEQQPQAWRMRLIVDKVGSEAKVSAVEFVQ